MVNTSFLTSLYLFKEEFAEKLSDALAVGTGT